jgi:hypothetical protein
MMREMKVVEFALPAKYGESATLAKRKERSTTMRKNHVLRASVSLILLTFFLLPAAASAANVTVGCPGGSGTYPSINAALAAIGQTGPSTITVTGTCQENVSLNNARSITIVGIGGAKVVGPLDTNAFDISLSQDITLQSLDISGTFSNTGNGGGGGVVITEASDVHIIGCNIHDNQMVGVNADTGSIVFLRGTTIQNNTPNDGLDLYDNSTADVAGTTIQNNGSSGPIGGVGVFVTGSSTILFRQKNFILNNADIGIQAVNLSHVRFQSGVPGRITTVQGHNTNGIVVTKQSHLQINGASPQVIQGNGTACPLDPTCGGIFAWGNSTVHVNAGTISGNHGSGISAQQGANVRLSGATVSNNTGDGVHIQWLSIGNFIPSTGNTITGNGGASVSCDRTSLALGDLSAFSKVKCEGIGPENEHQHSDKDNDTERHR